MHRRHFAAGLTVAATLFAAQSASAAGFTSYAIRQTPTIQVNNTYTPGATEFIIDQGGDKAGLGSSDIDGFTIGDIQSLVITRWDDPTRFVAGSGPAVAPYLNFWITDGLGHFAVAANEPSNPDFQPLYNKGYDLDFADLSNKVANIHETTDKSWLPNNGVGLTFEDLKTFVIQAPTVAQLGIGWAGLGTGAPRDAANNAYGVNWVFGDTLSNYVSGDEGYVVSGAAVRAAAPVPEPSTLVLTSLAGLVLLRRMRKARA